MRAGIRDMGVAMKQFWKSLKSEQAASMVEYALLVVLIAIVALVAVRLAGSGLSTTYSGIASRVENA
jgi:Flp pilus assembly pilin Flp